MLDRKERRAFIDAAALNGIGIPEALFHVVQLKGIDMLRRVFLLRRSSLQLH